MRPLKDIAIGICMVIGAGVFGLLLGIGGIALVEYLMGS